MHPWLNPWFQSPADRVPADTRPDDQWTVPAWQEPPRVTVLLPFRVRAWAWLRVQLTWPWIVRDMKRQGYQRTGRRTWRPG